MLRYSVPVALATVFLAACSSATDPAVSDREACNGMLAGDIEIEEDLASFNSSVDGYCDCYVAMLGEEPEDMQAAVRDVASAIVSIREERNLGLEPAAEILEEYAEGRETDADYDISEEAFQQAGNFIDEVRSGIRKNDGQCPVSVD